MSKWPHFYGLQPRWFGPDRLFKVFTLNDSISAGRVAGQFWDERSAHLQLVVSTGILGVFALPLVPWLMRRRREREAFYDSLDPGSTEFISADSQNYMIHRSEVHSVVVRRRRSLWTGGIPNAGSVDIHLIDGSRKRLILLGDQDRTAVEAQLTGSLGPVSRA